MGLVFGIRGQGLGSVPTAEQQVVVIRVKSSGFRFGVKDLGFRVQGFRVYGLGLTIQGLGSEV